jgi:dihydrofolate reductase
LKPQLALIAALSSNRVIGINNRLPWNIPEDLKRFRSLTASHVIVMGRKTYESIGKPLPGRESRVITRQKDFLKGATVAGVPGVKVYESLEAAVQEPIGETYKQDMIFVIGGGEIYAQALPHADLLYLTVIDKEFEGDAWFPDFSGEKFVEVASENRYEPLPFRFLTLQRTARTAN